MKMPRLVNLNEILKKADKRYNTYKDRLVFIISALCLDRKEGEMYRILLRGRLRIDELQKRLKVSERTVRRYIKIMFDEGFIKRKVIEGRRLAYEYASVSPAEVWKNLKNDVMKNVTIIDGFSGRSETGPKKQKDSASSRSKR